MISASVKNIQICLNMGLKGTKGIVSLYCTTEDEFQKIWKEEPEVLHAGLDEWVGPEEEKEIKCTRKEIFDLYNK
jgi:hypothetical protein